MSYNTTRVLSDLRRCVAAAQALRADPSDAEQWGRLRGHAADGDGYAYTAAKAGEPVPAPPGPTPSQVIGETPGDHPIAEAVTLLDQLHTDPGNERAWRALRGAATTGSLMLESASPDSEPAPCRCADERNPEKG